MVFLLFDCICLILQSSVTPAVYIKLSTTSLKITKRFAKKTSATNKQKIMNFKTMAWKPQEPEWNKPNSCGLCERKRDENKLIALLTKSILDFHLIDAWISRIFANLNNRNWLATRTHTARICLNICGTIRNIQFNSTCLPFKISAFCRIGC